MKLGLLDNLVRQSLDGCGGCNDCHGCSGNGIWPPKIGVRAGGGGSGTSFFDRLSAVLVPTSVLLRRLVCA